MLDVLHFLFEEDFTTVSEDHARSRSAIRDSLFRDLYGVQYSFKLKDPKGRASNTSTASGYVEDFESLGDATPVDPRRDDPFSSRNRAPVSNPKIPFVDADSVPLVEQSFEGLDAPLG